jgi:methylated-DNA-[protein]-cysteine S-methyltransferase
MALPMTKEGLIGTDFQIKVWNEIKKIPKGSALTYKELAKKINKPKAYRAVANACGKNPYPIVIPCHRVIGSNGNIGGYSSEGGVEKKIALLKSENVII